MMEVNIRDPQAVSPSLEEPQPDEHNALIQNWMDRFETISPAHVHFHDESLNAADYDSCISSTVEGADYFDMMQNKLPDPPTEPSPTANLQAVTVHFNTIDNKVLGLTMKYSDEVETQTSLPGHSLRGTQQIDLQLQPNEHFVTMQGIGTSPTSIVEIKFYTTNNRCLEACIGKPQRLNAAEIDRINEEVSRKIETGKVTRRIELKQGKDRVFAMNHVEKVNERPTSHANTIPSLETLTYEAIASNFKNLALQLELDRKASQQTLGERTMAASVESVSDIKNSCITVLNLQLTVSFPWRPPTQKQSSTLGQWNGLVWPTMKARKFSVKPRSKECKPGSSARKRIWLFLRNTIAS
jgi:hypothetical protein